MSIIINMTVRGVAATALVCLFSLGATVPPVAQMLGNSLKSSFSISIDYLDDDQRLYGYGILDLLNGHADPSFVRTVLFSRISRRYIPAPGANFVRLVINGENWGVYINVQQFNSDFLRQWYGTNQGVRWKVPAGRNRGGGLEYNGPDPASYKRSFQLNTEDTPEGGCWCRS